MSLLSKVSNKEVYDFLETLTIKSTYFANKIRSSQIVPLVEPRIPETSNPYTIHLAGEYVLDDTENRGYRLTKDTSINKFKNYWIYKDSGYRRLDAGIVSAQYPNPSAAGLYEVNPFVVKGIIDPSTGEVEDQEYRVTQNAYDKSGYLSLEYKNSEIFLETAFDEMMYVVSLDTKQTIPFTLENLYQDCANEAVKEGRRKTNGVHTKTLEAYKIPGRYFDILCQRYPKQVDLIKAIVYRVPTREISSLITVPELKKILLSHGYATQDYLNSLESRFSNNEELLKKLGADLEGARDSSGMTLSELRRTRIAKASNFELLAYDYERLDEHERISLLEHTKKVLSIVANRWAINEYNYEENYAAVLWTAVWSVLPLALIGKRYANMRTYSVCRSLMWDYLRSKGLKSYEGYLTEDQTFFMYKNINYLLQHRAQQKTLNILIDNILSDYNLNIVSKTVVMDTSKSLKKTDKPTVAKSQCETCSRNGVSCFKNITTYLCDEWLGTKNLCKAEPIVLDEEFAGASKKKIIKMLQKQHGYTEAAAEIKYRRSFIWKDDEVEAIKDDLDRDQLVDRNGTTESLDDTISREHDANLEPVYNSDIVNEQTVDLQHMNGSYAPTKLLEIKTNEFNSRFAEQFTKFMTETLLKLAPRVNNDGTITNKVEATYTFDISSNSYTYIFDYGELLAAAYLGCTREYLIDSFVDKISLDSTGKPLYEYKLDKDGNRIQIDTDDDGNPVYIQEVSSWVQKAFTDFTKELTYNFAIPDKCKTTATFKFGKPVLQEELIETWKSTTESSENLLKLVTNGNSSTKILVIRDIKYAVSELNNPESFCVTPDEIAQAGKDYYILDRGDYIKAEVVIGTTLKAGEFYEENSIWENFPIRLKILGNFTNRIIGDQEMYVYHENDNEIPLIPKYFKWYCHHLVPDYLATDEEKADMAKSVRIIRKPIYSGTQVTGYEMVEVNADADNDLNKVFVDQSKYDIDPRYQTATTYIDTAKKTEYVMFKVSSFIDVSGLLDRWIDATGTFADKSEVVNYIDTMYNIFEDLQCYASASPSIRIQLACSAILDEVISKKEIRFDLTNTQKKHDTYEGGQCAYFSDWLNGDSELSGSFSILDRLDDAESGWNEFNNKLLSSVMEGSQIDYISNDINQVLYAKLKELVVSLSSYRINFIDNAENSKECNVLAMVAEDAMYNVIDNEDVVYFDPVGDHPHPPRVGGYPVEIDNDTGDMLVPSSDLRVVDGKTYMTLSVKNSSAYDNTDKNHVLHPVSMPLGKVDSMIVEGNVLSVGSEGINIPTMIEWDPYYRTKDTYAIKDSKYFMYIDASKTYKEITTADMTSKLKSECTDVSDDAIVGKDESGNEIVYLVNDAFEKYWPGDKIPLGKCWENVNIYDIIGVAKGTPLLISKENNRWFYCTGTVVEGDDISYPANASTDEHDRAITTTGDKFDLNNDYSNAETKLYFDSVVYRVAVPTTKVIWSKPVQSLALELVLYKSILHEFMYTESTEPSILINESEYNEGN